MHQRMVVGLSWSTMVRSCCAGSYVCVSVFVVELCGWVRGWLRLMIMVGEERRGLLDQRRGIVVDAANSPRHSAV